ncbi:MAG: PAS domain S-box protein [Desulfobacterales bacterium]|nr:PAS domain S-box protein [Desulfobacterales bacterium]
MRIIYKMIFGFAGIALLVGVVGGIILKHTTVISMDVDKIVLSGFGEIKNAIEINYHIQRIESSIRDLFLESIEERPEEIEHAKEAIKESISELQRSILVWEDAIKARIKIAAAQEEELERINSLKTKLDSFIVLVNKTVGLQEEKGYEAAEEFFEDKTEPLSREIDNVVRKLQESAEQKIIGKVEEIRTAVRNTVRYSIITTIIAFLAAIGLGYFISKAVTNPIIKLRDAAVEIGRGNLDTPMEVESKDEIGELAASFKKMAVDLRQSIRKIQEMAASEKMRAEQLRITKDYINNIIGSMTDALIVVSPDGSIQAVNYAACTLLGYDEKELIGQPFGKVIPEEEEEEEEEEVFRGTKLAGLVENGAVTNVDVNYRARDGRKIPMSLTGSAMRDSEGNLSAVVAVARDMREIRRFISELHAARAFSDGVVRTIPSGLAALDEEGGIVAVNPGFSALFGDEEPAGMRLVELVPSAELEVTVEMVLTEGGEIRNLEISQTIIGRDEPSTFSVSVAGLRIAEEEEEEEEEATRQPLSARKREQRAKVLVIFDDITERKRLTSELEANLEELKRTQAQLVQSGKMSAVGELASGVAHEMNNPLTGVLTYAVLLKEKLENAPQEIRSRLPGFPEHLDLIKTSAQRCKSIADNLLAFSRQSESEMTLVDLSDVISRTFDLIGAQMRHKRIKMIREIPKGLPPIRGDANQLQHIFTNIALNAIQAMDPGGEITVCAKCDSPDCEVAISDTGPGIPRENLDRIFDPFFTTKAIGKGTGLGLSIAYGIVQNHGGEIMVDSVLGRGTTFRIKLPVVGDK